MSFFLFVLERLLKDRNMTLEDLKTLEDQGGKRIFHNDYHINRLQAVRQAELEGKHHGLTLVHPVIIEKLERQLENDEKLRLRAAIVADVIRTQIQKRLKRYSDENANQDEDPEERQIRESSDADTVAYLVFQLLTNKDISNKRKDIEEALSKVRGSLDTKFFGQEESHSLIPALDIDLQQKAIDQALAPAIEAYELGVMWLAIGNTTDDDLMRLGYLAMAQALLHKAYKLAKFPGNVARQTEQRTAWMEIIRTAYCEIEPKPFLNEDDEDLVDDHK